MRNVLCPKCKESMNDRLCQTCGYKATWPHLAAIPPRLVPYIHDLQSTGLYGESLDETVVALLQDVIAGRIRDREVKLRRDGELVADEEEG